MRRDDTNLSHVWTPWEIRGSIQVRAWLLRFYADRLN
jgi:hypothetical protein